MVTVRLENIDEEGPKNLSRAKLDQLERARAKSLEVRRRAQEAKLQGKLNHVQSLLGDVKPHSAERIAKEMVAAEDRNAKEIARLREKQIKASEELKDALESMRDDIIRVRKTVSGHTGSAPSRPAARSSPIPKCPASDVGSRASSSTVTSSRTMSLAI